MKVVKKALAIAAFALLTPAASMAAPVSSADPTLAFNWSYNTGSSLLTGFGSMTVSGFNSSILTIGISLTNTSAIGGQGGERLTAFGFGIDPNATGVLLLDNPFDGGIRSVTMTQNFPSFATVEICLYGGSTCAGGGNGGIFAGASDSFTLLLAGTWGSSIDIDPLALKYQTGYGSFEFSPPGNRVPEPSSIALLGLGLLGLAAMRRRKPQ